MDDAGVVTASHDANFEQLACDRGADVHLEATLVLGVRVLMMLQSMSHVFI